MIFKISNSDGRLRIAEIAALTDALGEAASQAYGRRTRRTVRFADGGEAQEERRAYDRYGRLVEIASFGTSVKWRYDARGRVARQVVDGSPIDFAYTKDGRLAGKWLGGRESPDASVEYEYAKDGRIAARTANGVRQAFAYDARGQLVAVRENGADVERYAYDRAGNMVRKTIRGKTTTLTFDGANQLVSSTCDGVTTRYAYDAAGRLVREGTRTYRYGYLDKVLSVTDGKRSYRYAYHVDGQLARADYGEDGRAGSPLPAGSEAFLWDGLALVRRGDESFVNEPHVGDAPKKLRFGGKPRAKRSARRARKGPRGSPVASSKGAVYFNDLLGTMVGVREGRGPLRAKQGAKAPRYTAATLTAFGEPLPGQGAGVPASGAFFTGKPSVPGLGYAFLLRSYRSDLAKWQTADPFGYPDGWNRLAYCNNEVTHGIDLFGAKIVLLGDVHYERFRLQSVWAECNHSYKSPSFSIKVGRLIDDSNNVFENRSPDAENIFTYDDNIVIDGHRLSITVSFEDSGRTPHKGPYNVTIDWWYQIKLTITESWDETVVDSNGHTLTSTKVTTYVRHQDAVRGSHTIPE